MKNNTSVQTKLLQVPSLLFNFFSTGVAKKSWKPNQCSIIFVSLAAREFLFPLWHKSSAIRRFPIKTALAFFAFDSFSSSVFPTPSATLLSDVSFLADFLVPLFSWLWIGFRSPFNMLVFFQNTVVKTPFLPSFPLFENSLSIASAAVTKRPFHVFLLL